MFLCLFGAVIYRHVKAVLGGRPWGVFFTVWVEFFVFVWLVIVWLFVYLVTRWLVVRVCVIINIGGCMVVSFVLAGGRFPCWGEFLVWVEYFCSVGCCLACVCYGVNSYGCGCHCISWL